MSSYGLASGFCTRVSKCEKFLHWLLIEQLKQSLVLIGEHKALRTFHLKRETSGRVTAKYWYNLKPP